MSTKTVRDVLTLLSGHHIRTTLSIPTAPSRLPSQFHAILVMPWWEGIRISLGLKAEKLGGYMRHECPRS